MNIKNIKIPESLIYNDVFYDSNALYVFIHLLDICVSEEDKRTNPTETKYRGTLVYSITDLARVVEADEWGTKQALSRLKKYGLITMQLVEPKQYLLKIVDYTEYLSV